MNHSSSILLRPVRGTTVEVERGFDIPDAPSAGSSFLHYQEAHDNLQSNVPNRSTLLAPEMNDRQISQDMGGVTLTGYRLSTMAILIGLGTVKALKSLQDDKIAVTWIEWVGGVLVAAIWYYVGLYEELQPPVAPWFFQEDYTLDCFYLPIGGLIIAFLNTYFWLSVGVSLRFGRRDLLANIVLDREKSLGAYTLFVVRFFFWGSLVISVTVLKACILVLYGLIAAWCMWLGIAKILGKRHRRRLESVFSNGFEQYRTRVKRHVWLYVAANVVVLAVNMPWAISILKHMLPPIHRV